MPRFCLCCPMSAHTLGKAQLLSETPQTHSEQYQRPQKALGRQARSQPWHSIPRLLEPGKGAAPEQGLDVTPSQLLNKALGVTSGMLCSGKQQQERHWQKVTRVCSSCPHLCSLIPGRGVTPTASTLLKMTDPSTSDSS